MQNPNALRKNKSEVQRRLKNAKSSVCSNRYISPNKDIYHSFRNLKNKNTKSRQNAESKNKRNIEGKRQSMQFFGLSLSCTSLRIGI